MAASYTFRGALWQYPGQAGWHFITLPPELAEELREDAGPLRKAFGSVPVGVSIAGQRWSTSVFPDSKSNSYLLPVKKDVRAAAGLRAGDEVDVGLELEFEG